MSSPMKYSAEKPLFEKKPISPRRARSPKKERKRPTQDSFDLPSSSSSPYSSSPRSGSRQSPRMARSHSPKIANKDSSKMTDALKRGQWIIISKDMCNQDSSTCAVVSIELGEEMTIGRLELCWNDKKISRQMFRCSCQSDGSLSLAWIGNLPAKYKDRSGGMLEYGLMEKEETISVTDKMVVKLSFSNERYLFILRLREIFMKEAQKGGNPHKSPRKKREGADDGFKLGKSTLPVPSPRRVRPTSPPSSSSPSPSPPPSATSPSSSPCSSPPLGGGEEGGVVKKILRVYFEDNLTTRKLFLSQSFKAVPVDSGTTLETLKAKLLKMIFRSVQESEGKKEMITTLESWFFFSILEGGEVKVREEDSCLGLCAPSMKIYFKSK